MTKGKAPRRCARITLAIVALAVTACGAATAPGGQRGSATPSPSPPAPPSAPATPMTASTTGAWRIIPSPSPSKDNYLNGVACTASNNCWAVGYYNPDNATGSKTLIEHWDGASWKLVSAPDPLLGDELQAVTCSSVVDCWAVGGQGGFGSTVIEHWDGAAWSAIASPNTSDGGWFNAVTCASASDCWAVGGHARLSWQGSGTLIAHWDGVRWRIAASKTQQWYSGFNELEAVACVSGSDCWAVGEVEDVQYTTSVMEHWNGTIWVVTTIEPRDTAGSDLNDVSCVSSNDCWGVGGTSGPEVGYLDHWNGTSWTMVGEPALPGQEAQLKTLRCLSVDACWAVGGSGSLTGYPPSFQLIAAVWNGHAWSHERIAMPTQYPPAQPGGGIGVVIERIACVSPTFCVGVGSRPQPNGEYADTLIEELS